MAKVGAQRAAVLTGKSKSTIQRAMNAGKLSFEVDENGRRLIDTSELERAFGLSKGGAASEESSSKNTVQAELDRARDLLESERLKMRVRMLEDQLYQSQNQMEDLKAQRDEWQKQAQQVLLTSQYSQRQSEELKAELAERERQVQQLRQKRMEDQKQMQARMQTLQGRGTNQNAGAQQQRPLTGAQQQKPAARQGFLSKLIGKAS